LWLFAAPALIPNAEAAASSVPNRLTSAETVSPWQFGAPGRPGKGVLILVGADVALAVGAIERIEAGLSALVGGHKNVVIKSVASIARRSR
jgi:hypothetical protein